MGIKNLLWYHTIQMIIQKRQLCLLMMELIGLLPAIPLKKIFDYGQLPMEMEFGFQLLPIVRIVDNNFE